ncbi:MAG: ABC transporter permease [Planctomycetaceae bacterium]
MLPFRHHRTTLRKRPNPQLPAKPAATVSTATTAVGDLPVPSTGPSRYFALRSEIPLWLSVFAASLCVAAVLGAWYYVTAGSYEERIISYHQLPSISETIHELPNYLDPENPRMSLWENTLVSLQRVLLGFSLAVLIGVPCGIAAGCFSVVRSFLAPVILFGRNIPVAALTALVFALFGTGELEKVMFIFIACVSFIISDTIDAVSDVAQRYIDTARTIGASRRQIIFKVLMPLALPTVFSSLRVMFGLAFGYIMLVEVVQSEAGASGLGALLNQSRTRSSSKEIMAIILITIPFVAWLIDQLLFVLQCWLFRWKYGEEASRSMSYRFSRWLVGLFWKPAPRPTS